MANKHRATILSILISALLLVMPITVRAEENSFDNLAANAAVLVEVDAGQVLFQQNMNRRHPADALAKVMTLLIVVSECAKGTVREDDIVEMTQTAWFDIESTSTTRNIRPGREMTLLDLMYCAFTGSSNEAGNMLAEHIAGDVDAFVIMMNEKAEELGCENTRFTNPHGQYDPDQYTTAYNQYLIYKEALGYPLFAEIAGVFRYTVESIDGADDMNITGTNSMLNEGSKYYYRQCTSGLASAVFTNGLTGATYEGGYSIVALAELDGLSLIAVVLGSDAVMYEDNSVDMRNLTEAKRLFEWGFSNFSLRTILQSGQLVAKTAILHGAGADFVNLRSESAITLLLRNDIPDDELKPDIIIYSEESGEPLVAPIEEGQALGELTLTYDGIVYGPISLVANTSIELHRLQYVRIQIAGLLASRLARFVIWVLIILVLAYVILVIRYNVIRAKRLKKNRAIKERIAEERRNQGHDGDRE